MQVASPTSGERQRSKEILVAVWRCRTLFVGVGIFTALVNMLALTGSLYMLQIYDRVIPSHSLPTLVGMTALMVGLYVAYGLLDFFRTRIMARVGLRIDRAVRDRVIACAQEIPLRARAQADAMQPVRDLDALRSFMSGAGPVALFDLPWLPLYLGLIYLLHPWLGLLATAGGLFLVALTITAEYKSRRPLAKASRSATERQIFGESARRYVEAARAMGFVRHVRQHWAGLHNAYLKDQVMAADAASGLAAVSRVFRLLLQSAVLGLGAWLVIRGEASGGVMIAASIMTSRALAPIEVAIANWRIFVAARQARVRLEKLLGAVKPDVLHMQLPRPTRHLSVQNVWVAAPGSATPILQNVSFELDAGAGLGVIGPSASGKSTLARALVGVWQPLPNRGVIRLDGAAMGQWDPEALGRDIGYLPQDLQLFDSTVMENIARHDPEATSESVIEAAIAAGAHELIVQLPKGYDTNLGDGGCILSAGQRQRIALARALYGNPFLIVLDEPNSNLDAAGEAALTHAIRTARARGAIVIAVAHRPSALAGLDQVLFMAGGQVRAFGPKEQVLQAVTQDAANPAQPPARTAGLKVVSEGATSR